MIELTDHDGVAILQMADGKANTMSVEFCDALIARFEEIRLSSARAVVMTGTDDIFRRRRSHPSAGWRQPYIREFLPVLSAMFATVFSHPKPVVAAINGHAIAGGCVLACAADRRLMVRENGRIGVTELIVGVPFPAAAMEIMRCATAPQYLEDVIFGAVTYAPADAVARGLVHELVDAEGLLDRASPRRGGSRRSRRRPSR